MALRMRRALWITAGVVLTAVAVLLVRGSLHQADAASEKAPALAPVGAELARAQLQELPIYLTGIGNVQAALSVTVHVRVDGQLRSVAFKEGQPVRSGDLLAQIDPDPYQAQLEAALAQERKDEASYQNALVDLKRYEELLKEDSIAQQTYDTQLATVASAKAAVGVDKAQVDNARVQLNYTTIRSPISGVTGIRLVDPGNIVHATDTTGLVVVNQVDPISVVFTLPESAFQGVNRAMHEHGKEPLTVNAYSREDQTLLGSGKLLLLNNQIDPTTGTVQLKASFPNPEHKLWPGQFVNIRVITSVQRVVTVPQSAVQRGPSGLYIYVVKADSTAAMQPVEVALDQDGKAVISKGLAPGTEYVVDGQFRIKPGLKVVQTQGGSSGGTSAAPNPDSGAPPAKGA